METISYVDFVALYETIDIHVTIISAKHVIYLGWIRKPYKRGQESGNVEK